MLKHRTPIQIAIAIVIVIGLICGTAKAEWRNTLKPKGEPAIGVMVVEAGTSTGTIQCPAKPTGPEKKAADDLQQWIREMTGATLEIVPGDSP